MAKTCEFKDTHGIFNRKAYLNATKILEEQAGNAESKLFLVRNFLDDYSKAMTTKINYLM